MKNLKRIKKYNKHQEENSLFLNENNPAKLIQKYPMRKRVIDENDAIWDYYFSEGKVYYIFFGYAARNIN